MMNRRLTHGFGDSVMANDYLCFTKKEDTLLLFDIAMENGLFIDGLPIKNPDFPWL